MTNLFAVQSPLQALCAVETALLESHKDNILIVRYAGDERQRNNEQLENVLKLANWRSTHVIRPTSLRSLNHQFLTAVTIKKIKKFYQKRVTRLFIGDFRADWMHHLRACIEPIETLLLDDGAATIKIQRNFFERDNYYPSDTKIDNFHKRIILNAIHGKLSDKPFLNNPIGLCTSFDIKLKSTQPYIKLDFQRVQKIISEKFNSNSDFGNMAMHFGSKYSEAGIISEENERIFLTRVLNYYREKGITVAYIPHRDETKEKLDFIEYNLGFHVSFVEDPAEILLMKCSPPPLSVSAAYSTVINTAGLLFEPQKLRSFKIPERYINPIYRKDINDIYSYFLNLGIDIIDFDTL